MASAILVAHDGSEQSERALPCAVSLAQAARARLVLVRAVQEDVGAMQRAEDHAQALAHRLREQAIPVTVRVRRGTPLQVIQEEVQCWQPEWVVLSTHGKSGRGRWLYGRVAEDVLRTAEAPVLLVPPTTAASLQVPDRASNRVRLLVPLDGSPAAETSLRPALRLARLIRAQVLLLRVVEPPLPRPYSYDQAAPYVEFDPHIELARAREYLHARAAQLRLPTGRVECHAVVGTPEISVPLFARDHHIALTVITSTGAGGAADILGSTALGTLQLAHVPLIVVPTGAQVAPRDASTHRTTTTLEGRDPEEERPVGCHDRLDDWEGWGANEAREGPEAREAPETQEEAVAVS